MGVFSQITQTLRYLVTEKLLKGLIILSGNGEDQPHKDKRSGHEQPPLELSWVWSNREVTWALFSGTCHADARVYRHDAVLVREQRIDVQLSNLGHIGDQLGYLNYRQVRNSC